MPQYRIYQLNDEGHSFRLPLFGTWRDDQDAIANARMLLDSHNLEIWCGSRKVATIKPDAL